MKFYSEQISPFLKEFFKDNYSVEVDSFDFVKTRKVLMAILQC